MMRRLQHFRINPHPNSFYMLYGIDTMRVRIEADLQIVVRKDELESYLKEGWQFVSVLPSKKILIKK